MKPKVEEKNRLEKRKDGKESRKAMTELWSCRRRSLSNQLQASELCCLACLVNMPQAPTSPTSSYSLESQNDPQEESSVVHSSDALSQSLDSLLERYLGLLDRHQKLQAELAKQFSSVWGAIRSFWVFFMDELAYFRLGISFPGSCQLYLSSGSMVWRRLL